MAISSEPTTRSAPPLLMRERRRSASRRWHWCHDDRRVLLHRHGCLDPERVWLANIMIALPACWTGLFGDPRALTYVVPYHGARILKFPERRSEIAKMRSEIQAVRSEIQAVRHRVG
jgi:hypothetical protein